MSTAFTGQGISTGFDRRYGVLRFLSTTPLGRTGLIAGKVLAVLAVLALQVVVVTAVALLLGWQPDPLGWVPGLALLVLGAAAFTALGLLVAGTVRPEATLAITNLLWILLGALGGIVIPAERLPALLQSIVQFLPSGAGSGHEGNFLAGSVSPVPVLVLLLWTAIAGGAATRGSNGIEKTVSTASRPPRTASRNIAWLPVTVDKAVKRLAVLSLIGQTVLIVTGGAVRLSLGPGLPHLAALHGLVLVNTPEMGIHGIIEFGNRLLTFALAAVAVAMLVYLWNLRKERRDLFLLALGLLASIPAQAIIGGIRCSPS